MDIYLKDCRIVDGSGMPPYRGGILVSGGRIAGIADQPPQDFAGGTVDCAGAVVTPGFIDCHSHNDWFALSPQRCHYFDPFLSQGITTFVTGNCGFSVAGYDADTPYRDKIGGGLFRLDENSAGTTEFEPWFAAVDGSAPANMAILVGHGTARIGVNGDKDAPLSPENRARMLENIESALQSGAAGVSLGLMYEPGIYAPHEELLDVARLCAKHDKILTVHPRAESTVSLAYKGMGRSHLLRALDELTNIVRETGVRLQCSHLIFVGRRSWGDVDEATSILRKLKEEGYDVGFDMYPLDYGASIITVVLPGWYLSMSRQQKRKLTTKLKLAAMVHATMTLLGFTFSDIRVAYGGEGQKEIIGKTITEIATMRGLSPFGAYLDVCEKSDFQARVLMGGYQNDAIVRRLMANDQSLFMTDAWVEELGKQSGAIYGAFPRFLSIGRELGWPLEKTIAKMTGQSAQRFQLRDRGFIRPGYWADLNVLNPDQLQDRIQEELPPLGIRHVFISGQMVLRDGELLQGRATAGRAIRVNPANP